MATTTRTKDRALGKDKRGTSPSNLQTSTPSQRVGSSGQASTGKEKASEKAVPNYLKPTLSSRNEPLKFGKKNISHKDNQKLLRRRSFDKPPSASPRGQKALISPSPRDRAGSAPAPLVPRERKITVRASSFGRLTVTATKTVADRRVSKTPKAVRSPPVGSSPTKMKNTFSVNTKESSNNASALRRSSSSRDHTTRALDHETSSHEAEHEDKEDLAKEVQSLISDLRLDINVPKSETEVDVHVVETEDERINSSEISTCTSEDQSLIQELRIDQETDDHDYDNEQKLHDQLKGDTQQGQESEKISKKETRSDGVPEEIAIEEEAKPLKEIEETGEDDKNVGESIEDDNKKVEEEKLEHVKEAASEGIKAKEDEDGRVEKVASKVQRGQEKKESPSAAYNDVIEETASKLMEKRKNKVRALVGAFETVIDYESGSSK